MFIYNNEIVYTYPEVAINGNISPEAVSQWVIRSNHESVTIPHETSIKMFTSYKGRKGVRVINNDTYEEFMRRDNAEDSARARGTAIHIRTMKVDYPREQPRSYQAQYIKAISVDGFKAEFAVKTGRIDAFYFDGTTAHIVDFKTGAMNNYSEQMKRYAEDIRAIYPKAKIVSHVIYTDHWETTVTNH